MGRLYEDATYSTKRIGVFKPDSGELCNPEDYLQLLTLKR